MQDNEYMKIYHANSLGQIKKYLETKKDGIKEVKKDIETAKIELKGDPNSLKEKIKSLEGSISSSSKEIISALKGDHTKSQKEIKEKYIELQKTNLDQIDSLIVERKGIKEDISGLSDKLSTEEKKIDKMLKDIKKIEDKGSNKSIKDIFRSKQKIKDIQSKRELDHLILLKNQIGMGRGPNFDSVKEGIELAKSETGSLRSLDEKISELQTKQEKERVAVDTRLELAGKLDGTIGAIDNIIVHNKKSTKNSSKDLKVEIEEINNKLSVKQAQLKEIEHRIIDTPIGTEESDFYTSNENDYAKLKNEVRDLLTTAEEMISWRPTESSVSQDRRTSWLGLGRLLSGSTETSKAASDKPLSDKEVRKNKELNDQLGVLLKEFNGSKSLDFARGVFGIKAKEARTENEIELIPGKIYGELEVLKSKIDDLRAKIGDSNLNEENIIGLNMLEKQFSNLSDLKNTKEAAAKLLYFDPIESSLLLCANRLLDYNLTKGNAEKNQFENDIKFVQTYLIDEMNKNLIGKNVVFPESFVTVLKEFKEMSNPQVPLKERIAVAKKISELHKTAQSLGVGIQSTYVSAFGEAGVNPKKIPFEGIPKSIPTISTDKLESFYSSMKKNDRENEENYSLMFLQIQTAASSLIMLKESSPSLTVKELLEKLEETEKTLKGCQKGIEEIVFDEKVKYSTGFEERSLANDNKDQLLQRLEDTSKALRSVKEYASSLENKAQTIKDIPLTEFVSEKTFEGGTASINASSAVYRGVINLEERDKFVKEVLTFFTDSEIKLPYSRGPKEKDWYVILDEKTGELKRIDPKTKDEEERKIIKNLNEKGHRIAFTMERVGLVKEF